MGKLLELLDIIEEKSAVITAALDNLEKLIGEVDG
jgi:hypothetical protein